MKKMGTLAVLLLAALSLAGCGAKAPAKAETELIVFAASSMTETLTDLGARYMEEHPQIHIVFNFDSSGTLQTQIQEGAQADLFLSAGQKQMNILEEEGYILPDTRLNLLENKVALVVGKDATGGVTSYEELIERLKAGEILLAMGNADVPVGQYTQKIFNYYGVEEQELAAAGCITYGSNVKEVTTQVREGVVDCGIIYQTDAYSAGLTVVDTALDAMCGQVIYPAAVLKATEQQEEAKAFLAYLMSDTADAVFEGVGFTPLE